MVWSAGQNSWRRIHLKIKKTNLTNMDILTKIRSNRAGYDFFCQIFHKSCWYFVRACRNTLKFWQSWLLFRKLPFHSIEWTSKLTQKSLLLFSQVNERRWTQHLGRTAIMEKITNNSLQFFLMRRLRANFMWLLLGRCSKTQNGNLRWHLPLGVRPPPPPP